MRGCTSPASSVAIAVMAIALLGADNSRYFSPGVQPADPQGAPPSVWSATQGIAWKTALPGAGASSPIVVGDKIFLTCYSGYGQSQDNPGAVESLTHHVVCLSAADGKVVWDKSSKASQPERAYQGFIPLHGYASASVACDGQAVYAFFGRSGVYAYSMSGEPLWHVSVGEKTHEWGSAASPVLFQNLLIVNASIESGAIVALDKATGKEAWRVGGIRDSWSTPALVALPDGRQELVVSLRGKVLGLDPASGRELWNCAGVQDYVCPSITVHDGVAYVAGGRQPQMLAIRAGGQGDVSKTHVVWEVKNAPKVATPLYHDGRLYWVDQRAVAACVDAKTGKSIYKERLQVRGAGEKIYASPVVANGKLYVVTREDGTLVLAEGTEFKELGRNRLDDPSIANATPLVLGDRLLLRSDKFLYCIGK